MLSIGNVCIRYPILLSPMAGITDLPFRLITRSFGCELAFTEMVSATSLAARGKNTLKMLTASPDDRPVGVQLLGGDEDIIRKALEILSSYPFDIVDFNAACPVSKVVSKGKGAGLLKEPGKFQGLLRVIVANSSVPVTVKIRSGWDENSVNAVDLAMRAQDAGVSALFIHGRTRRQGYSGTVDYDIIGKVKRSVRIPVVASGDALTPSIIWKLFTGTGCDGVAIARGALGNPWIFRSTIDFLNGSSTGSRPVVDEIMRVMKAHLDLNVGYYGERAGVMRFRKFFGWYTKGMAIKELKAKAFRAGTSEGMSKLIAEIKKAAISR